MPKLHTFPQHFADDFAFWLAQREAVTRSAAHLNNCADDLPYCIGIWDQIIAEPTTVFMIVTGSDAAHRSREYISHPTHWPAAELLDFARRRIAPSQNRHTKNPAFVAFYERAIRGRYIRCVP